MHIVGLSNKKETQEFKRHKKVLEVCVECSITELPRETAEFFGSEIADLSLAKEFNEVPMIIQKHFEQGEDDSKEWIEVDLSNLPKDVKKLLFIRYKETIEDEQE